MTADLSADLTADALALGRFLSGFQTTAGLQDPDGGVVLAHAYATDFFAWHCALLYRAGQGEEWLARAIAATRAAIALRREPSAQRPLPPPAPQFHWEFKNLALLQVAELLAAELPAALGTALAQTLRTWRDLNVDSTNWAAMRALTYQQRHARFGRRRDAARSRLEWRIVLDSQSLEGFFPDTAQSHSLQYHAYVLALLALAGVRGGAPRRRAAFLRGVRLIADFVDPAGEFNYYGRGQAQIFGYASLILALREAATLCSTTAAGPRYHALAARLAAYVRGFRRPDGSLPLVLHTAAAPLGWYDYNNRGDYLAFCGVLYLLAAARPACAAPAPPAASFARCYPGLGLAVLAGPDLFAAIAARGDDLAEPVGLIHCWPAGAGPFGGPEPARAGGLDYAGNYLGPLVDGRPVLQRRRGTLYSRAHAVGLVVSVAGVEIAQTFTWGAGLRLDQCVSAAGPARPAVQFVIPAARPPESDALLVAASACPSPRGWTTRYLSVPQVLDAPLTWVTTWPAGRASLPAAVPPRLQVVRGRRRRPVSLPPWIAKSIWRAWVVCEWNRRPSLDAMIKESA